MQREEWALFVAHNTLSFSALKRHHALERRLEALHRRRSSLRAAAVFDALQQRLAWRLYAWGQQSCLRARRGLALRAALFSAWVDARDEEKFGTMVEGPVTVAASLEVAVGALAGRCDDLARHAEDSLVRQTALIS